MNDMRHDPDLAIAAALMRAAQEVRNQRRRMADARSDGELTEDEAWVAAICDAMAERIERMAEPEAHARIVDLMAEARNGALREAAEAVRNFESIESAAGPAIRPRPAGSADGLGYIRAILALEALPDLEPEIIEALDAAPTLP